MGGMLDGRHVHVQCVGKSCDREDCMGVWKIKQTSEDFDPGRMKQKGFTEKLHHHSYMCVFVYFSHLQLALNLPIRTFWVIKFEKKKKKKKKKKKIIFQYITGVVLCI